MLICNYSIKRKANNMNELVRILLTKQSSRKELAANLGITISYISKLATGDRKLSRKLAQKIKTLYPELGDLCIAIQLKKLME